MLLHKRSPKTSRKTMEEGKRMLLKQGVILATVGTTESYACGGKDHWLNSENLVKSFPVF